MTISPKNYSSFNEGLVHIKKSFSKFIRNKYVADRVKGGLYIIETKHSLENAWNIHIHALIYGRWLDNRIRGHCSKCGQNLLKFDRISKKLYCANRSCNSTEVIAKDFSKINAIFRRCSNVPCETDISRVSSQGQVLNYVLKYVASNKENFYSPKEFADYMSVTYKQKLVNTFGVFFRAKFVKQDCYCYICLKKIDFIYDQQVVQSYRDYEPPPQHQLEV
jgi:hypothetical protein